ncbi:hypothetical protein CWN98_21500 [Vibrio splendidus]|nr:hypothetical protein CWN98_21500 [Vibrio splendidus]PTP42132.1 hypothetical protein CWO10_21215 [Vibrio splendidus]
MYNVAIRARKHRVNSRLEPSGVSPSIRSPIELLEAVKDRLSPGDDVLNVIARVFNIGVEYVPLELEESGSLAFNSDREQWMITINSLHHPKRQRFTFAHEIAHFFLHRNKQNNFSDTVFFRAENVNSHLEFEANNFAGALLMPKENFVNFIRNNSNSIQDISNEFNVSAMAVKVRADVIRGGQYGF